MKVSRNGSILLLVTAGIAMNAVSGCSNNGDGTAPLFDSGAEEGGLQAGGRAGSSAGGLGGNAAAPGMTGGSGGGAGGMSPADGGPGEDGATTPPPRRSAGCGKASPASGALTLSVEGQEAEYVLSLPEDYDPDRAYAVGFGFHGRNRTGPQCQAGDCIGFQAVMRDHAVLVYMTSLGGTGWEGTGERELNVAFFQSLLAHIKNEVCIDEGRVFAAGTSSGAHFANVLGCRFGNELLAVAPVAGYLPERNDCNGEVPALVIHGVGDGSFASGQEARDFYVDRNGCSMNSVPPVDEAHARVVAAPESHECVSYQDCNAGKPVVWCEHNEGGYDGSTHGWPAFAGQRIWDFVQSL